MVVIFLSVLAMCLALFTPNDLQQKALDEKKHRDRSTEIKDAILPFINDKKRFNFLAEALEGYFDIQRAIEIDSIIRDANIVLVGSHDGSKVHIYHNDKLIKEL